MKLNYITLWRIILHWTDDITFFGRLRKRAREHEPAMQSRWYNRVHGNDDEDDENDENDEDDDNKWLTMILRWINVNVDLTCLDLTSLRVASILWWILLQQDKWMGKLFTISFSLFFWIRKVCLFIEDKWICLLNTYAASLETNLFDKFDIFDCFRAYNPHGEIQKGIKVRRVDDGIISDVAFPPKNDWSKSIRQPKTTVITAIWLSYPSCYDT